LTLAGLPAAAGVGAATGIRDCGREEEVIFRRSSINGRQRSYVFSVTPNCDGCHRGIVE